MEQALFIQKIRRALGRYSTEEEARVLASQETPTVTKALSPEEKLQRFTAECGELSNVQIFRAQDWTEAQLKLVELLEKRGAGTIAVAGKDLEPESQNWKKWGPAKAFDAVEKADVGVIQADFGLAETGSVVLVAGAEKPRIVSLLPPVCYFVLSLACLYDSMLDLMKELHSRHEKGEMPATVNVVTGPSRTADIELSLTVGVHGPGEVHVILVG